MAFFGQDNSLLSTLNQGFFGVPTLKDYTHASKTFATNGYELSPRYKFLFHVFFNINTAQIPQLQAAYGSGEISSIGLMVKSIQLPQFKIDTHTMNQYNRKRVVQTKMQYQPCRMTLHDDQGDLIRNMWYNYYAYYYKDPTQPYQGVTAQNGTIGKLQTLQSGFGYNTNDIYSASRTVNDWGYIGESYSDGTNTGNGGGGKPAFFRDITIYGLNQKKFAAWTLINPMISSWNGDMYDYSEGGGTMQNEVSVEYETVKYYTGQVGARKPSQNVAGFADPTHYDTVPSGISTPGGVASVFGQGGLLDGLTGGISDLQALASGQGSLTNVLGAVQKAGTTYNTFKNQNINQLLRGELKTQGTNIALYSLPNATAQGVNAANGMIFPRAPTIQPGTGVINGGP
jgi:hypothetical protein